MKHNYSLVEDEENHKYQLFQAIKDSNYLEVKRFIDNDIGLVIAEDDAGQTPKELIECLAADNGRENGFNSIKQFINDKTDIFYKSRYIACSAFGIAMLSSIALLPIV